MKKIILTFIAILCVNLSAKTLYVAIDNNNSIPFKIESSILRKSFNKYENILTKNQIDTITLIRDGKKSKAIKIEKDLPSKTDFKRARMNLGILELLDKLFSVSFNKGDTLVIVSSLDYIEPTTKTDSSNKIYNDAWITSTNSPLKRVIDSHPNMPLKDLNIIVLDPTTDIKYQHSRERFFSYLFSKLGAKLLYYGSLDRDRKRVIDYTLTKKDLTKLYQSIPLKEENILMIDDKTIQYQLP